MLRGPGIATGCDRESLIGAPDLYPTLLDLLGHGDGVPDAVQGTSYAPRFRGQAQATPGSAWYGIGERRGVRTREHMLVLDRQLEDPVVLHDLVADPCQLHNVAAQQPDTVQRLIETELEPWLTRIGDPWDRSLLTEAA